MTTTPIAQLIDLDDLLPLESNSKRHNTATTVASIKRYGYRDYIEIDNVFEPPRIVCGHDRKNALDQLREDGIVPDGIVIKGDKWLVPCIVKESKSEAEAIQYSIDNNLTTIKGANLPMAVEMKLFDVTLLSEQFEDLGAEVAELVSWTPSDIEFARQFIVEQQEVDNFDWESFSEGRDEEITQTKEKKVTEIECPECHHKWTK
jgi:hypothetical protein